MDLIKELLQELIDNPIFIFYAIFIFGMQPLGTTGLWIRKGVEAKRQLEKVRIQAIAKGQTINEKWYQANRKASIYIWGPVIGWIILYILIFIFVTPLQFFFSLLALIIPIFGYHGKIFYMEAD